MTESIVNQERMEPDYTGLLSSVWASGGPRRRPSLLTPVTSLRVLGAPKALDAGGA